MANEKRLFDANALQLEPDPWGGMNGVICVGRSGGKTMATVQAALKRMIDDAPTVDAVEVVRCKECKHWTYDGYHKHHYCSHKMGLRYICPEKNFCSYGERREGE